MSRVNFNVNETLKENFKEVCKIVGVSPTEYFKYLMVNEVYKYREEIQQRKEIELTKALSGVNLIEKNFNKLMEE